MPPQIPYGETDDINIRDAVRNGERQEIPASVPKPFSELISRCWTHDAVKRPTMREVVAILEPLMNASPVSPSGNVDGRVDLFIVFQVLPLARRLNCFTKSFTRPNVELSMQPEELSKRGNVLSICSLWCLPSIGEQIKEAVSPSKIPGFDPTV